jgi:hypothetical protein
MVVAQSGPCSSSSIAFIFNFISESEDLLEKSTRLTLYIIRLSFDLHRHSVDVDSHQYHIYLRKYVCFHKDEWQMRENK